MSGKHLLVVEPYYYNQDLNESNTVNSVRYKAIMHSNSERILTSGY